MSRLSAKWFDKSSRARLRYRLRNPEFQNEFNELRRQVLELPDFIRQLSRIWDFQEKWGVPSLARHPELFQKPDELRLSDDTVPQFESILTSDIQSTRLLENAIRSSERRIRRDLRKQGVRRSRKHTEKVDFYLQVYDRRKKGEAFDEIARALNKYPDKKPPGTSTFKMAYRAATRNIFGPQVAESKNALPLIDFDLQAHFQTCKDCIRRAKRGDDELCPKAEEAVNREVGGWYQRELTVGSNPVLYRKKGQGYKEDDKEDDKEDE